MHGQNRHNSLDIEFNDDVIEKFSVVETVQIFVRDRYASNSWWRRVRKQPATHTHTWISAFRQKLMVSFISEVTTNDCCLVTNACLTRLHLTTTRMLLVSWTQTNFYNRYFSAAGPRVWNRFATGPQAASASKMT